MALNKLQFAPGISKETTNYTASGGWFGCDKVRFRAGMPEKIGGWLQITSDQFAGACRYIHQWSSFENNAQYIALGTSEGLYILWGQSLYNVTPPGFQPGLTSATVGQGWGIPPWGGTAPAPAGTGWGLAFDPRQLDPVNPTVNQLLLWSIDNFGEDMVACVRNGPIYYWKAANGVTTPAGPLPSGIDSSGNNTPDSPPTTAIQVLVSPNDRHLIAYGCQDYGSTTPDPLLVRWSDAENLYWTPLRTNSAGSQRLSAGSYIICALRTTSGQILIWTDLGLWLQQFIGMPYVFGFQPVAQGLSIVGPNAMINAAGNVYWMDRGLFMVYSGGVQEVPCSVKDYVFSDLDFTQSYKVYAGHNHAFHEVTWFYPSLSSNPLQENNRYVTYNYVDQLWTVGTIQRTAWLEMGRAEYPVATDLDQHLIYYHEYGDDANNVTMPAWIESADIDADGGDHFLFLSRLVPDVQFRGSGKEMVGGHGGTNQTLGITIFGRSLPLQPKEIRAELTVTPMMPQEEFIRVRDRQISFRFFSNDEGVGWRLGTIRTDWQLDGRR